VISGLTETPAHLQAVHTGHGDVQHDGVGGSFGVGAEGGRAIVDYLGLVALEPKSTVKGLAHRWLVVDYKHSHPLQSG
jgi:hypothetical protein